LSSTARNRVSKSAVFAIAAGIATTIDIANPIAITIVNCIGLTPLCSILARHGVAALATQIVRRDLAG
jgi:hypothetical protein